MNENLADQRIREKRASREEDERALKAGEISQEQLAKKNGVFGFPREAVKIVEYK